MRQLCSYDMILVGITLDDGFMLFIPGMGTRILLLGAGYITESRLLAFPPMDAGVLGSTE